MHLTIISPGKKLPTELVRLFEDYQKRLNRFNVKLELNCPESGKPDQFISLIQKQKSVGARIVVLDERGHQFSSSQLAVYIDKLKLETSKVVIAIGDSYGIPPEIFKLADVTLSLGPLTLPHQLVRIITAEQIYRAFSINAGLPYHHE